MTKSAWREPLVWWVYGAIVATALCGLVAITVQQNYRQSANDPQIQMAEDAAARLAAGEVPAALMDRNAPLTNIQTSLAPWVAVYDQSGTPLEASAELTNAPPKLPAGVFDTSNASARVDDPIWIGGEYRFTWQPQAGVRQAVVLAYVPSKQLYVAAGRSLREVEVRESQLNFFVIAAWLATLAALAVWSVIAWWLVKPR